MNYHKCLGYFSVRYLEATRKWAMLYTCGNADEMLHRPLRTNSRGVFLRTATRPWGEWSEPQRIFDPAKVRLSTSGKPSPRMDRDER